MEPDTFFETLKKISIDTRNKKESNKSKLQDAIIKSCKQKLIDFASKIAEECSSINYDGMVGVCCGVYNIDISVLDASDLTTIMYNVVNYFKKEGLYVTHGLNKDQTTNIEFKWEFNSAATKYDKQEYTEKPENINSIRGASAQTIGYFMTNLCDTNTLSYPHDLDDWERCRSLLLQYPEWRKRLLEMSLLLPQWEILVNNWENIEKQYNEDYEIYGGKLHKKGKCDQLIKDLLKNVK